MQKYFPLLIIAASLIGAVYGKKHFEKNKPVRYAVIVLAILAILYSLYIIFK